MKKYCTNIFRINSTRLIAVVIATASATACSSEADEVVGMVSPGMQVSVGSDDEVAESISYEDDVKGPIDSVAADGSLVVMGQKVIIDLSTGFDVSANQNWVEGDIVEVTGLRAADGSIRASYISLHTDAVDAYELAGTVSNLDTISRVFNIGGLTIDYQAVESADTKALSNGDLVEVSDYDLRYEPGSMNLIASSIELEQLEAEDDEHDDDSDRQSSLSDDYEIEGLITVIDAPYGVTVDTLPVRLLATTEFEHGDITSLMLGTPIEVEGRLAADGVLEALEVEFLAH